MLRVFSEGLPRVGESIWVKPGVGGVPWFVSSTGDPIAPCHDPGGASIEVAARLSPFAMAAACVAVGRTSLFRHLARRVRDVMRGNGARVR